MGKDVFKDVEPFFGVRSKMSAGGKVRERCRRICKDAPIRKRLLLTDL